MGEGIRPRLKTPDRHELRNFGLVVSAGFAAVFGGLMPWMRHHPIPLWPFGLAAVLTTAALLAPRTLVYPQLLWSKMGHILGWINTRIILMLLFYLVFLPAGLVARAFGWDPMKGKFEHERPSYRVSSRPIATESMERPY